MLNRLVWNLIYRCEAPPHPTLFTTTSHPHPALPLSLFSSCLCGIYNSRPPTHCKYPQSRHKSGEPDNTKCLSRTGCWVYTSVRGAQTHRWDVSPSERQVHLVWICRSLLLVFIFHTAASTCSWCVAVTCDLIYRVETQTCSLQVNLIPLLKKHLQRHFFLCFVSWRETWYCFTVTWWRDQGPQQLCSAPGAPLYVNQALQVRLKTDVKEEIIQTQKYGFFLRSQNAVRG